MRKRILKSTIVSTVACLFAVNTYAMGTGFYMGLMMGPATNNAPSLQAQVNPAQLNPPQDPATAGLITTTADPRSSQFAARIYIGNQFSRFAAIEGGITLFSSIHYDAHGVPVYGGTDQRVRAIDVVGKGIIPFSMFSIYGKFGIAGAYLTTGGAFNGTFVPATATEPAITSGSNTYRSKFAPTYGIGAAYDINQSWQTDISYNGLEVGSSIGTVSYIAISISYHFTDKYCGQFLCDD